MILRTFIYVRKNIFRFFFGMMLIGLSYLSVMFYINYTTWDERYFPFGEFQITQNYFPLYLLAPIALLILYSVFDHFQNFNKKSPVSKFKYTFVLVFSLAQLVTICLYMGQEHEYLLLLAFPMSIILSRGLNFMPKYWQKEVFL